jgi:hypothetical protein
MPRLPEIRQRKIAFEKHERFHDTPGNRHSGKPTLRETDTPGNTVPALAGSRMESS